VASDASFEEDDGTSLWGCLRWIKNCIAKYINGKLGQEDMLATNRQTLRQLARMQHLARVRRRRDHRPTGTLGLGSRTLRRGTSIRGRSAFLKWQEKKSSSYSFAELVSSRPELRQLLYVLCLDELLIFYVPASGRKRIHQLAGLLTDPAAMPTDEHSALLYVSVRLLQDQNEYATFAVSPFTTLDTVLRHLSSRKDWGDASPLPSPLSATYTATTADLRGKVGGRRERMTGKGKFNSFSKLHSQIHLIESSPCFYHELSQVAFQPQYGRRPNCS
jgi:hypothetical protein